MPSPRVRAPGVLAALMVAACAVTGCGAGDGHDASAAAGSVSNAMVKPAEGGHGRAIGGMRYDVRQFGYRECEYFFAGTARSQRSPEAPPAPYRSRMIVWTPADAADFNGTTVVEWAHVSDFGQFELTVILNFLSPMLEARGFAFVLVSAEEGGVCDRRDSACSASSLQGADPGRYSTLDHPGDEYSFDIFNQALQAIKYPSGTSPLGELQTRFVIATGFQPSIDKWFPAGAPDPDAFTTPFGIYGPLNAYLDSGADDAARLADAFLIDAAAPAIEPPGYRVPTLHHLDESAIRRTATPDGVNHVTWEVTGAAHVDRWMGDHVRVPASGAPAPLLSRAAEQARREAYDDFGQRPDANGLVCVPGPSTGSLFPRRFTLNAALIALHDWLETGIAAPAAPRIQRVGPEPDSPSEKLARDSDGNALGGLRSPVVEVPVAGYNGEACVQAGTTQLFSSERIAALYPTHRSYVEQLLAATDEAVAARQLLCEDAETILRKASASSIGGDDDFVAEPGCAREPPP